MKKILLFQCVLLSLLLMSCSKKNDVNNNFFSNSHEKIQDCSSIYGKMIIISQLKMICDKADYEQIKQKKESIYLEYNKAKTAMSESGFQDYCRPSWGVNIDKLRLVKLDEIFPTAHIDESEKIVKANVENNKRRLEEINKECLLKKVSEAERLNRLEAENKKTRVANELIQEKMMQSLQKFDNNLTGEDVKRIKNVWERITQ